MRLFLAAALTPSPAEAVERAQEALRPLAGPSFRWVGAEGSHLTLRFLGEADPSRAEPLAAGLPEAIRSFAPFAISAGGFGAFPDASRPRVLWLGLSDPEGMLAPLVGAVDAALRKGGFRVEERPFHAHLTLARARPGRPPPVLRDALRSLAQPPFPMRVDGVDLVESTPGRGGSTYRTVARASLEG